MLFDAKKLRKNDTAPTTTTTLKTIGFISKTTALHVYHTFYYIYFTSTARLRFEASQCNQAMNNVHEFSFLFLKLDKVLKNSTPRETAYI